MSSRSSSSSSSGGGMSKGMLAVICFALLTVQNSALGLMMTYSRRVLHEKYLIQTSVLVCEILKFVVAAIMVSRSVEYNVSRSISRFKEVTQGAWPMAIPAVSYCLQNLLAFMALQRLDAATYSVVNQLKILTSAVFARLMLGRQISWNRWRALTLLLLGVLLVQREPCHCDCELKAIGSSGQHAVATKTASERVVGFAAALLVAIASGYAGIYFEQHLRRPQASGQPVLSESDNLWRKNFQLSLCGIVLNALVLVATDGDKLMTDGFFYGYSMVTWVTIWLSAFGGIMVALVVQYTDTIVKGFATSIAIILTALGSWVWFQFEITFQFCIGVACVIIASFNYNQPDPSSTITSSASPTSIPNSPPSLSASLSSPSQSPLPSPTVASSSSTVAMVSITTSNSSNTMMHRQKNVENNNDQPSAASIGDIDMRRITAA